MTRIASVLLLLGITINSWTIFAQIEDERLDSLQVIIDSTPSDSLRIEALLAKSDILVYSNYEGAKEAANECLDLSKKLKIDLLLIKSYYKLGYIGYRSSQYDEGIKNYSQGLGLAEKLNAESYISEGYIWLGNLKERQGNYSEAIDYHEKNIEYCIKIEDHEGIASSYNNLGNISNTLGDYTKAIDYYTQSVRKYEAIGDVLTTAIVTANMGMIHNRLENYDLGIEYLNKAMVIFEKVNHQGGINFSLKNLGVSYKNKGDLDKAMSTYRKAFFNYEAMSAHFEMSGLLQNIGNVYWERGFYDSARLNYLESLKYAELINDTVSIGRAHNAIGASYFKDDDFEGAEKYFKKARNIGKLTNNPLIVMSAEVQLKEVYEALKDYEKAFNSLENHQRLKDSLQSAEKLKMAEEIEAKYQNEKKQKEIELLSSQNQLSSLQIKKRENERNYLLALTLAILIIGFVVYRQYKVKKSAHNRLQQLNQMQSSFFANISHEFRTPLTLIMASMEKLKNNFRSERETFTMMERNSHRLLQLINQLLDLSKLESGSEKLALKKVRVESFVKVLASSFQSLADHKSISYAINVPPSAVEGYLDTDKVEKITYNLLSNAFKFTPEKGRVDLTATIHENELVVEISDSGIGISEEALEHIFQRFYQSEQSDSREFEGSGIGLALISELVDLHGGTLGVTSELNKGTTFIFTIPLLGYDDDLIIKEDVEEAYFINQRLSAPFEKEKFMKKKELTGESVILVVEDNPDLLSYLVEGLGSRQNVITASNGQEGYDLAVEHIPDLIITDLMMPKMDGREMCRQLRMNEKTNHIPLIMLTAKADRSSKIEGLETGADDYITKPFDARELHLKIKNQLEQRDKLQQFLKDRILFPNAVLSSDDRFIKKASAIIMDNLSNSDFSVEDFNLAMGYSRMQLHRKIKAITGQSANEFIRAVRLQKAARLLENNADQVSQIAYETGFSSPSYFAKCFKETYGLTPREFASNES